MKNLKKHYKKKISEQILNLIIKHYYYLNSIFVHFLQNTKQLSITPSNVLHPKTTLDEFGKDTNFKWSHSLKKLSPKTIFSARNSADLSFLHSAKTE